MATLAGSASSLETRTVAGTGPGGGAWPSPRATTSAPGMTDVLPQEPAD